MSEAITKYQQALRDLQQAENVAKQLVAPLREWGYAFGEWRTVAISGTDAKGFPPEMLLGHLGTVIPASRWPTAQELAETLAAWHRALHQVQNLYRAMSEEDRTGFQHPPARPGQSPRF